MHRTKAKYETNVLFGVCLVNTYQNMIHKLSLDANSKANIARL